MFERIRRAVAPRGGRNHSYDGGLLRNFLFDVTYREYQPNESTAGFKALWGRVAEANPVVVVGVVRQWKCEGNMLSGELMRNILVKLCSEALFRKARPLVSWLDHQAEFQACQSDILLQLDILCGAWSWKRAWTRFSRLPTHTEEAYLVLLEGCCKSLMVKQAEKLLLEMKQKNVLSSGRAYAVLIKMYLRLERYDLVTAILQEFEASGLPSDASLCWTLVLEKRLFSQQVLAKMEAGLRFIKPDSMNRKFLLRVNAALGKADEVHHLWRHIKACPPVTMFEYLSAICSFGLLGEVEKAEDVSLEMQRQAGELTYYHSLTMLRMYAHNGLMVEAEAIVPKLVEHRVNFEQCHSLVHGYLLQRNLSKALECFSKFLDRGEDARQPQMLLVDAMCKLTRAFARRGDVQGAESVMAKAPEVRDASVYNGLLQAYLRANKQPGYDLESRLKHDKVVPDGSTRELLERIRSNFPSPGGRGRRENAVNGGKHSRDLQAAARMYKPGSRSSQAGLEAGRSSPHFRHSGRPFTRQDGSRQTRQGVNGLNS